ncbi:MAG: SDR family NAD(P)-dependent oxidoreductase [Gemmataceae bacterium]
MRSIDVIVLTPSGVADPALAIAACRAGVQGVWDLEYVTDRSLVRSGLAQLNHFTTKPFGVKLGRAGDSWLPELLAVSRLELVILAGGIHDTLPDWIACLRQAGRRVLLEAVTLQEAQHGQRLGVDGLILKGHEAGGRIGADTTFILSQRWQHYVASNPTHGPALPVWLQGGIGLYNAAACAVGGATGIVLDNQLLLAREANLEADKRDMVARLDGSETLCLGERLGEIYRCYSRPGLKVVEELAGIEQQLFQEDSSPAEKLTKWRQAVRQRLQSDNGLWLIGQDAAFAKRLADRYVTVSGITQALGEQTRRQLDAAQRLGSLDENAPLAERLGTRYPIVQGPMTRVSDTAAFADAVARAGALPFLALALMKRTETETLLAQTSQLLGNRPWGAGILGFAPTDIRRDQMEAIKATRPPFALIAGGRPDQAQELEKEGIPTFLHVPSPGLLRMFLRDGARRFIFEGRECGGHVGPRSSFVLWETMCDVLMEHIGNGKGNDLEILFAGGIHDNLSAAMVAALSASLAERGVAIGVLVGTAYLFTQEAVTTGAIVAQYQQEALDCRETVLLETGPGHAIRCVNTPYFDIFEREKRRLLSEGKSNEEIREALEAMNIGRLRIASKGIDRAPASPEAMPTAKFISLSADEQRRQGMYMIGQVASMRDRVVSMAELHADISAGGTERLRQLEPEVLSAVPVETPSDVAIIGMSGFFPKANDVGTFWENILNRVDAIIEVPPDHWDWRLYYDTNSKARDKISSKWGGFLSDIPFDPLVYGMPPNTLTSIEPVQLLVLEAVRQALADAGYDHRPFDRERTGVVLGAGGGAAQLSSAYGFRSYLPMLETIPGLSGVADEIMKKCEGYLPEWTEDSFPGILLNVIAGRVANRFNLGGPNFSIDAACGSSLAALYAGVRELEMRTSDMVIVLGADTVQNPFTYMAFSKTHAFSVRGRCSTFDEAADGIVISEGIGVVILKRLADAERDGDRIYAVIKGMGASSDGKDKGLTAPRPEGQLRALRRAYAKAGVSPCQIGLVEAHGTGTVVGDKTEVQSLGQVFREAGAPQRGCVIGSVKSMIGHTKCAAGLAGLINATLSLYHKTLPPILVQRPNTKANFEESPFFLNREARPWIHGGDMPRTAGVSAFGFGGTNFHAILQEYTGEYLRETAPALTTWPAELCVWRADNVEGLQQAANKVRQALDSGAKPKLADLAYSLWVQAARTDVASCTLAIVATALDDLKDKLQLALSQMQGSLPGESGYWQDPRGIYLRMIPQTDTGKLAFVFPGQGSQYPNMIGQLALVFPEVREAFDLADRVLAGRYERSLGRYVFPPSAFTSDQEQQARRDLTRTDVAQPAIGAASLGMYRLLSRLGLQPDYLAGHSYGDYVALCAAGALSETDLLELSYQRGRVIAESTERMPGGMAAIEANLEVVQKLLADLPDVTPANINTPTQTVISGTNEGLEKALARLRENHIRGQRIPVACGFHSPLVAPAREPFARALAACPFAPPRLPVFANTTAAPYPNDPAELTAILADHLTSPVRFQEEIEALYAAGCRVFVEVGPQSILTGLIGQTLADRPHLAIASDIKGRPGLLQLHHLLGQLLTQGFTPRLDRLYVHRRLRLLDLANLEQETGQPKLTPSTWLVNSTRVRPLNGPEPQLFGQARPASSSPLHSEIVKPMVSPSKSAPVSPPGMEQPDPAAPPAPPRIPQSQAAAVPVVQAPPPASSPPLATGSEAAQVMVRFQDLMARFLDTQRSIMTSFLQGTDVPAAAPWPTSVPMPQPTIPPATAFHNGQHSVAAPPPSVSAAEPLEPPVHPEPAAPVTRKASEVAPTTSAVTPTHEEVPVSGDGDDWSRETLTTRLLDIVRQRTGYPPEMLGLDLDLEGDLGIDSIKRVEILGSLAELDGAGSSRINQEMEKLTGIKTLGGIIDCLATPAADGGRKKKALSRHESSQLVADNEDTASLAPAHRAGIQRMIVTPVDIPLPQPMEVLLPTGPILLTDDGRGIAEELANRFRQHEIPVALVRMARSAGNNGRPDVFYANLTEPKAVEELLHQIHQQLGPLAGFIHLLPLAEPSAGESWNDRVAREVKSLFLLARGLADELCQAGRKGQAVLLAATGLGGCFGVGQESLPPDFFPGSGGIAGVVKSLGHEWSDVLVRVIDFARGDEAAIIADKLWEELGDPYGPIEVGYFQQRRVAPECVAMPLPDGPAEYPPLTPQSTVMLTGGARGITAAVALELARHYQPNLVLVGQSPLPPEEENLATSHLTNSSEIKAMLIARLRKQGGSVTPAKVESAYQRLMKDREIRSNLQRLRDAGAKVHYYQADVRDETAMSQVMDDIYQRFGNIDGVIHGAGVIQDKLIRDKTPESFDRVFGTKVDSALILSRHLRWEQLKYCMFFASVAGRFGNRGQSDYAAANEVLTKLAAQLDREKPGRVVSIVWGPWSSIGMVAELEQHLGQRGLQMIPPQVGPLFLHEELAHGAKGTSEVVIAGEVGQLALSRKPHNDAGTPDKETLEVAP